VLRSIWRTSLGVNAPSQERVPGAAQQERLHRIRNTRDGHPETQQLDRAGIVSLANFAIADNVIVIERRSAMPTRNISLTREQDAFIEKTVKSGEYQNASEAVRDALRALQQRRREDTLRLKALRVQIKAGVDALKRGEFTEVADADLDRYLETLTATAGRQAR